MINIEFLGKNVTSQDLKEKKWLRFLILTNERIVNPERVQSIEETKQNQILAYVERTLSCPAINSVKDEECKAYVIRTLEWAEVAKGGTKIDRARWKEQGLALDIHNEASAEIYRQENKDSEKMSRIVYVLIKTHGLLGQHIRGEVNFSENCALRELLDKELVPKDQLKQILEVLNEAIISAVSQELWENIKEKTKELISVLCDTREDRKEKILERLKKLFPENFEDVSELNAEEQEIYTEIFEKYDLWYPTIALSSFKREEICAVFRMIYKADREKVRHISFYKLAKTLFYDYEGKKKVNIYKKRIIEFCIKEYMEGIKDEKSSEHIHFICETEGDTLFFDIQFTRVCDSLINFCVEAERSGIMNYQKNITTIFDLFGFRRDIFDRLNNEEKYLQTMNDAQYSRKLEILEYVSGNKIVDVGSGGGVLLDDLERRFPKKQIIGTDISENVIESLNKKIKEGRHGYSVHRHNFVEGTLEDKADTIIFSSILHEVYSYTEFNGKRFNIESVKAAIRHAYESLNEGGRLIIRDGVLSIPASQRKMSVEVSEDKKEDLYSIKLKSQEGMKFLENYLKDFKGLTELRNSEGEWDPERVFFDGKRTFCADINLIREFLYTYTWGIESYSCEVNEQFGYFTLDNFAEFLESLGMNIIKAEAYLEQGYAENLDPLVELLGDLKWEDMPSNCILVAEKRV